MNIKRIESHCFNHESLDKAIDLITKKEEHYFFDIKIINHRGESDRLPFWGIDRKRLAEHKNSAFYALMLDAYIVWLERVGEEALGVHYSFFHAVKEDLRSARQLNHLRDAKIEDLEKVVDLFEKIIWEEANTKISSSADLSLYFKRLLQEKEIQELEIRFFHISKILDLKMRSYILCSRHPLSGEKVVFFDGELDEAKSYDLYQWLSEEEVKRKEALRLRYFRHDDEIWIEELEALQLSSDAQIQMMSEFVDEKVLSKKEAIKKLPSDFFNGILISQLDPRLKSSAIQRGLGASPGGASGHICQSAESLSRVVEKGQDALLYLNNPFFKDLEVLKQASGVICTKGGLTSHLAIICRSYAIPCIVSAGISLEEGQLTSIDGKTGEIFNGEIPLIPSKIQPHIKKVLEWSDEFRDRLLLVNADTPIELMGTESVNFDGVGLCRTENLLFLPNRLEMLQRALYTQNKEQKENFLNELFPFFRNDFQGFFHQLQGRGVSIRLLDTLLENLLVGEEDIEEFSQKYKLNQDFIREENNRLFEKNGALGIRGARLGVIFPEIYQMLIRSIFEAAVNIKLYGAKVDLGILIPLVTHENEFYSIKEMISSVAEDVFERMGEEASYQLGVMLETPRLCLNAHKLAKDVHYFSFGTNDLTQMTLGMSRDDSSLMLKKYADEKILSKNPFVSIDQEGVGELMKSAIEKTKAVNPDLRFLVCGEHVQDRDSLFFFDSIGMDAYSCSVYSVPYVKSVLAQITLKRDDHA